MPLSFRGILVTTVLLVAALGLWRVLPVAGADRVHTWPRGEITYFDASGMSRTVDKAAQRWNDSGAHVKLRRVDSRRAAAVVVHVDDGELRDRCGDDCLGFSSSIGRPSDGHVDVLLAGELGGEPRPLSVWVAAHEFGHVLGLRHRSGHTCSLMSEHAFDTRCAPSLQAGEPTAAELACVPAPTDVKVAAQMYGGAPWFQDPRCR